VDEGVTQKDALVAFLKASLVAYSSTKGVVGSEFAFNSGGSNSASGKGSKAKKDKASVEVKGKVNGPETAMESHERAIREETSSSSAGAKKAAGRQTTVHSWVDSCTGINCGTSCPITQPTAGAGNGGGYDIQSMGGAADSAVKKNKMLSQYNAESTSEEDSDQKFPFKSSPLLSPKVSAAAVSAVPKVVPKAVTTPMKLIIDDKKDAEAFVSTVAVAAVVAAGVDGAESCLNLSPPLPIPALTTASAAVAAVAPVVEPFAVALYLQFPLPLALPLPLLPPSVQVQA
jgi:hypothetical protein